MNYLRCARVAIGSLEDRSISQDQTIQLAIANALVAIAEQLTALNEKPFPAPVAEPEEVTRYIRLFSDICHGCKEYKKNLISIEGVAICLDCLNVDPCVYVQQKDE